MRERRILLQMALGVVLLPAGKVGATPHYDRQIRSALQFLVDHQTSGHEGYEVGQWRARVTSYAPSPLGVGRFGEPFDDPTAFVTASVGNVLAEIYTYDSRYNEIPIMLRNAKEGLHKFRWGSLFNFYPPKIYRGIKVRGPRFMYLAPQWEGFANIPPDADTTSLTYTLLHYLESIERGLPPQALNQELPDQVISAFSLARDRDRLPHAYNAVQGHIETGAFLTWLFDENNPDMPRNIFAAPHRGTRIPFNYNDIDCVVNANVLKLLTYAGTTKGPGYRASCEYINRIVRHKQFYFCGMYYPSYYALPYAVATNVDAGNACLTPSRERILNFIIAMQRKDGSWQNSFLARPDFVQSTAWALNTLVLLGDSQNSLHRERVRRGISYLLSQAQRDSKERLYWPGQVFFAATFVARFPVVWRSTSYTTALAIKALLLADPFLEGN